MQHYRIFVSEAGGFRDSSNYVFIAEFANQKDAINYVGYMGTKKRYGGKDIIIKAVNSDGLNARDGNVNGVISSIGEELHIEEYDFI